MKNIAKTLIGLSIICILFSGCEAEKEMTKQEKLIVKPFALKETAAKSNTGLGKAINQVRSMSTKNNSNSKLIFDEKSGMYFDDQKGLYIEKDGLKSYTFPVLKTTSDAKLKNICFNEKQNGSYDVYLVKYDLTKAESLILTDQQKEAREKQFIPLIKDGVTVDELKMQCVDIYLSTTTEYVVPVDQGELTGNTGTTTVSHTTSVLIGSSCTLQGLSGGNQSGGNASGTSGGSGLGNGDNNQTHDDDIITGLNTRDLEGVLGNEELFYYNYTAFTSGLNAEENAAFNAHPELMEYFIANGWSNENQGLVRTLIDKFQGNDYTEEQKETLSQLVSVCAQNHATFSFNDSLNASNAIQLDNGNDLSNLLDNVNSQGGDFTVEQPNQTEKIASAKFGISLYADLTVKIKQNMSPYSVVNVSTQLSGLTVFDDWSQTDYTVNINDNEVRIDLYGVSSLKLFIHGIGTFFSVKEHYVILISKDTGIIFASYSLPDR